MSPFVLRRTVVLLLGDFLIAAGSVAASQSATANHVAQVPITPAHRIVQPATPILTTPVTAMPIASHAPSPAHPPVSFRAGWTSSTSGNDVRDLAFDADDVLWGVGSGGVGRWDIARGTSAKHTIDHDMAFNDVSAVVAAPDGPLWFGTKGRGLSRFDGQAWTTYKADDRNADGPIAIAPDGAVWFGTAGGASRFDGKTWTTYKQAVESFDSGVVAIAIAPDGAVWFGAWNFEKGRGTSRFDDQWDLSLPSPALGPA